MLMSTKIYKTALKSQLCLKIFKKEEKLDIYKLIALIVLIGDGICQHHTLNI